MWNTNKQNISKYLLSTALIVGLTTLSIQAWNGLTASPWDKLDYQKWNELVASVQSGIPSGAVMAFNLSTCPTGWSAYNDAVWRTIIGVGNWAGSNNNLWDIGGHINVKVSVEIPVDSTASDNSVPSSSSILWKWTVWSNPAKIYSSETPNTHLKSFDAGAADAIQNSNMQPYVALLYCVKN